MSVPSSSPRGVAWSSLDGGSPPPRRSWTGVVSLLVHAAAVAAVVVVPLLYDQRLPETATEVKAFFAKPLELGAPSPPPPPPPAAARVTARPPVQPVASRFVAPVEIPTEVVPEQGLDLGVAGGAPGGVEGGVPGGVVGGVVGGLPEAPPPPAQSRRLRAGIDVREPRRVKNVAPVYPQLAVDSRVQGAVILECEIDARGHVDKVKVVSGNIILVDSAVNAVRQWVYTPTLVNGVPVPILMNVTVTFELTGLGRGHAASS
jgi:protein TonB